MRPLGPENPKDRFDVYRFYNGLSAEAKEGIDKYRTRIPLVKTFLLEHVACRSNGRPKHPADIFKGMGVEVRMLDDHFMGLICEVFDRNLQQRSRAMTGFLERYDERFFAYYTCEESADAKKRVAKWVQAPDLDFAWFSSPLLQALWDQDVCKRGDERFGKLVFRHESIFDMPEDFSVPEESTEEAITEGGGEEGTDEEGSDEDRLDIERRKARFVMGDKIGRIKGALSKLQKDYEPLYVLHALRLPSRVGRGGHELYQTGQVTNRTDSFEDHRNTVRYLYRIYKSILDSTEKSAWHEIGSTQTLRVGLKGVPLVIKFAESLSETTFNRWVQMAFQKRNRFKLWGEPIRLGPTKVHIYGADRHLWQPINLELTAKGAVAILPQGTCGNTFHRLVTNIQHYVCPKIQAWIGSEPFEKVVSKWPPNAEEPNEV
ncbi:MAG: hypothetical protein NTX52_14415 [Planctomycetota bacterium]|nr:hypothetical protein [Planctomycetota bacterium]